MADQTGPDEHSNSEQSNDERRDEPRRPQGAVALAEESADELPALLAIAVGVAIVAIAIVWPTIDPLNADSGATETVATDGADHGDDTESGDGEGEEASAEPDEDDGAVETVDVAAIVTGLTDAGYQGLDLSADGAVVTATGDVPDEEARAAAIDFITAQPGVEAVIDELTVTEDAGATGDPGDATITAAQRSVVLTGTVPDQATADAIVERAESVYSADLVDNQLVVDEAVAAPTQITIAGSMTDEVLFDQISAAFDDVADAEVADRTITLEESTELESSLNSLDPIQFASGSAIIQPESESILDDAADFLLAEPDVSVEIGGHTDSRGSDESNETLSQARADSVVAALQERGVTNELIAVGFGESRLKVSPDDSAEAQQENRRIEFRLLN